MTPDYLEIVTPEVDALCAAYAKACGASFGDPVAELGNARTADMPGGGRIGIRAPMSPEETPVTRPYWKVDDVQAALDAAVEAGAEIMHPPLEIPGQGRFAIYMHGGIQNGLWEG